MIFRVNLSSDAASSFKKFFNEASAAVKKPPLTVTTSIEHHEIEYQGWTKILWGEKMYWNSVVPCFLIAQAIDGLKNPQNQLWRMAIDINGQKKWAEGVFSYEVVMVTMRAEELRIARKAGITGTDDEIIARRKPVVASTNILKFT